MSGRSRTIDVRAEPGGEGGFIEGSGGEAQNGLCGGFFGGGETIAVQFEEEDADEEAGAFVCCAAWAAPLLRCCFERGFRLR